jgi:hypothetical protein
MDRQTVYSGAIPLETDLLNAQINVLKGLGSLAQTIFGSSTLVDGLACTPGTGLTVSVAPGSIYTVSAIDSTAYSSLAANSNLTMQQGVISTATTLSCPAPTTAGQSINYLVEVQFQQVDNNPVLLPFYNSANPTVPWSGPGNAGTTSNTTRAATVGIQIKAGTAATTGTQTTPTVDSGWTALYVVTVVNGAASIVTGNITTVTGAPFLSLRLTQCGLNYNFIYNTSGTLNPPQTGPFNLFNTASSGVQTVTFNVASMTPYQSIASVTNLSSGTTQAASSGGVYVNFPQGTNGTAPTYVTLQNNTIPQGLWSGSTTYGLKTQLAGTYTNPAVAILSTTLSLVCYNNAQLIAYNPVTRAFGTPFSIGSLANTSPVQVMPLSTTTALLVNSAGSAAVVTVTGTTIAMGTVYTIAGFGGVMGQAYALTVGSSYLFVGTLTTTIKAVVLTISGTTVSYGSVASGTAITNAIAYNPSFALGSSTTGLAYITDGSTGWWAVSLSISGTTVTWGTNLSVAAVNVGSTSVGIQPVTSTSYAVCFSSASGYQIAVASVSGSTTSVGTSVFADSGSIVAGVIATYSAGVFLFAGATFRPFTVSGTTVTLGTVLNASATNTKFTQAVDGTWYYTSIGGTATTAKFTATGTTITQGEIVVAAQTTPLVPPQCRVPR